MTTLSKNDLSIVLCGPAGRGIQTAEKLLVTLFRKAGYHVFAFKEVMSRVRGGSNSTTLRIASEPVNAAVDRIDILFPLDRAALKHVDKRLSDETLIIGEKDRITSDQDTDLRLVDAPLSELAKEIGGAIYSNTIVTGIVCGLLDIDPSLVHGYLKKRFGEKKASVLEGNIQAVDKGYEISAKIPAAFRSKIPAKRKEPAKDEMLISGAEAVGMGALAGGCRFIASYPMSPSTAVLTFLAQQAHAFGLIAEQAEDEIAAVNMSLGASYAGVRSMVTTSGGGFALMAEGLSLAGMLETPLVIHLAQRPGPATGLPTRTEQGDLLFAMHAGHGEFARVILAPGTADEGFFLTRHAFHLADKYQIPVIILTDQYLMDSYHLVKKFDLSNIQNTTHLIDAPADYRRFTLTESGISPRAVPGRGRGLVVVDSDEHDEEGHITEDLELRTRMVDKRLKRMKALTEEAVPPVWTGEEEGENLIICWGSTAPVVTEALRYTQKPGTALCCFRQVYPVPPKAVERIKRFRKVTVVENNATGQFARVLESTMKLDLSGRILQYDGLPFSVETLVRRLNENAL